MALCAMTERCDRSALWGSLWESQLPQHLSVMAYAMPPPLKGRLETVQNPTISLAGRLEKGVIPCFHGIPNYSAMPGGFGGR